MSTVHGGPGNIVTSGLVLNLDAANPRSYPPLYNGTIWTTLAGSSNGTLVNGPTFNSGNGGSIVFDGTNDYVNLGTPSSINFGDSGSYTFSFWFMKTNSFKDYDELFSMGATANQRIHFLIDSSGRLHRWDAFFTTGINLNVWVNVVYTYQSQGVNTGVETFFINGFQTTIRSGAMPPWIPTGDRWLGFHSFSGGSWPFQGRIVSFLSYNRALTAAEVLQNYNATRARFGV